MKQTWPIIGRDAELAMIVDALRRGVGTVVVGEAGLARACWSARCSAACAPRAGASSWCCAAAGSTFRSDDSADLLWRLAHQQETRVVATVRAGEQVPDRVTRLWTGGACERLDLTPLALADVRRLLEVALAGDVEDRLPRQLMNRAAGNPLLLRELVRSGVDSGAIMFSQRVWRLAGDLPVGPARRT